MKKNNSHNYSFARPIFLLSIVLLSLYFMACTKESAQNIESDGNIKIDGRKNSSISGGPAFEEKQEIETIRKSFEASDVEVKPEFPGGNEALVSYIIKKVVYPEEAKKKGIQGKVHVKFQVTKTGEIGEAFILGKVNPDLQAEALRVIKSMPKWKAGQIGEKFVDTWLMIPVNFRIR